MSGNTYETGRDWRWRWTRRLGAISRVTALVLLAEGAALAQQPASQCDPVKPNQLYRFIEGLDGACPTPMSPQDIQQELHDPFWIGVLSTGNWPGTVQDIATAVLKAFPAWSSSSFLVGEGMQVPASVANRDANRDLRYVLGWGPPNESPAIFLSARPPQVQGGTTETALQVLSLDPDKKLYNYYQFINNQQNYVPPPSTWTWSGDSHHAWQAPSAANGCFKCHLNGSLNMKELTPPWNNWNATAPGQTVNPNNVPQALTNDPLSENLASAQVLQTIFQGAHTQIFSVMLQQSITGTTVANVSQLLRRLITNTTINFASNQNRSNSGMAIAFPNDFFLYDSILRDPSIGLKYTFPTPLSMNGKAYASYIRDKQFRLVNCTDGEPQYTNPGTTFFAAFVPVPAFEDTDAIRQLLANKVISQQFAAAVLMVDFQNPVFSQLRSKLMTYANQIQTAGLVPSQNDAPTQFAKLVLKVAEPCSSATKLSQCTPEEQFLYYYQPTWKTLAQQQITSYLQKLQQRLTSSGTGPGVDDYMALSVSRGFQFANWNPICNLDEKELLLPCTSSGPVWVQMNVDGTIGSQPSYQCTTPPPNPCSCPTQSKHQR